MRFKRYYRDGEYKVTPRKIAALKRKQRLELEKYPLLAEEIQMSFKSTDEIMRERSEAFLKSHQSMRSFHAKTWNKARKKLYSYTLKERKMLIEYWNNAYDYANAVSFACFLHSYEVRHNYLMESISDFFKEKSTHIISNDIISIDLAKEWLTNYLIESDNYIIDSNLCYEVDLYIKEAQRTLCTTKRPVFIIPWKKTINKIPKRVWIDDKFIVKSEVTVE